MTKFSVVLPIKDEAKSLPGLAASLAPFFAAGGRAVVLDTGSVDGSPDLARSLGFTVFEVGDAAHRTVTQDQADQINAVTGAFGEDPLVSAGDKVFDFALARNKAAELSPTDWVLMPDADEVVTIDVAALEKAMTDDLGFINCRITAGTDEWETARCYNRKNMHWECMTHEGLYSNPGRPNLKGLVGPETLSLTHHQLHKEERPTRIKALALNTLIHPTPRVIHYFGRELLYRKRYKTAIAILSKHVAMGDTYERSESWIYIGDAYRVLDQHEQAYDAWMNAYLADPLRRIGLLRCAEWATVDLKWQMVASMCQAALEIPYLNRFVEDMTEYRARPYELIYPALWQLGRRDESQEAYQKALDLNPSNPKTISDSRWYRNPLVSIVIPYLPNPGRYMMLSECKKAIHENAGYRNFEIIQENDSWEDRQGASKTLKKGVAKAKGELVMYLGCDTVPQPGFLKVAVDKMRELNFHGLVGLNDGHHGANLATHWLASKSLLPLIGGEYFHTGYHHCFCDNELMERAQKLGLFLYAEDARITHDHPAFQTREVDEVYKIAYDTEKQLQDQALYEKRRTLFPEAAHPSVAILPRLPAGWEKMSVLNVGIGPGDSALARQLNKIPFKKLTHLEVFQPYLDRARSQGWAAGEVEFIKGDMRSHTYAGYDLVMLYDVLEHIPKEDALSVISWIRNAGCKLLIFGPLEPRLMNHRHGVDDGNEAQAHVSLWTEADFKDLGFQTEVIPDFHEEHGEKFPAIWAW